MSNCTLNIIHQNIRSMRKNFDLLITNLSNFLNFPDIICLSETHIYDYESDLYSVRGYNHLPNCNNSYKCGGVSLLQCATTDRMTLSTGGVRPICRAVRCRGSFGPRATRSDISTVRQK